MISVINDLAFAVFWYAIPIMVVLLLVSLGGLMSERSGVVNIALEGIMVMGAFTAATVIYFLRQADDPMGRQWMVLIGLFVGATSGFLFSFFHAFAAVRMQSNQIISATALNMFAPALHIFMARTYIRGTDSINIRTTYRVTVPVLSDLPVIGPFFSNAFISTYIGIAILIALTVMFYKTKLGLRLRSCGENPHAADSLGINVGKIRYIGVMMSGLLAGLGGAAYMIAFDNDFDGHVLGLGFLALAMLISGQWNPLRILVFSIVFSFFYVVSSQHGSIGFLSNLNLPSDIYRLMPFLITLIILAFFSKTTQAPKALGEPYDVGKR